MEIGNTLQARFTHSHSSNHRGMETAELVLAFSVRAGDRAIGEMSMSSLLAAIRRKRGADIVLLLSPATMLVLFFLVFPLLIVISYSFAERDPYGAVLANFTLENYQALLRPLFLPIVLRSFAMALSNTVLCLLVAYPVAYFIGFRAKRFSPLLVLLIIIPFWTNFLIRISAWIMILGRYGLINSALHALSLITEPIQLMNTHGAVMIGLVYGFLPLAVLPIYASLDSIDRSLLEAAQDLGAHPLRTHLRVTIPLSLPGVIAASLFVFVPSLGVYVIPALLGGGKRILIGNLIVMQYLEFRNIPFGSAVATVLLAVVLLGIGLYMRLVAHIEEMQS